MSIILFLGALDRGWLTDNGLLRALPEANVLTKQLATLGFNVPIASFSLLQNGASFE